MGRLTLRHIHLLTANWVMEQRITEERFFKLMSVWSSKEHPIDPELFPFLATGKSKLILTDITDIDAEDEDEESDDELVINQIAASLGAK